MKENKRKCTKCGASPSTDPGTKLFRFPNAGSRNNRSCQLWAKFCYPKLPWWNKNFHKKLHASHKMLCHRHFKETAFSDYESKKLTRFAIPDIEDETIVFDREVDKDPEIEKNSVPSPADVEIGGNDEIESEVQTVCAEDDIVPPSEPHPLHLHIARICRVCLALDVKMFHMKDSELKIMFQTITGLELEDNEGCNVGSLICWECAARLRAASTFRSKALLSDTLLQRLINKGEQIGNEYLETLKEEADTIISPKTLTVTEIIHIVDIEDEKDMTQLEYFKTVKEKADCLVPPKTLSATEITHIDIDQNEMNELVQSDDDDRHSILNNNSENQESIINENSITSEIENTPILANCNTEDANMIEITDDENSQLTGISSVEETIVLDSNIDHTALRSELTSTQEDSDNEINKIHTKPKTKRARKENVKVLNTNKRRKDLQINNEHSEDGIKKKKLEANSGTTNKEIVVRLDWPLILKRKIKLSPFS